MAGPWDKYGQKPKAAGPWSRYGGSASSTAQDVVRSTGAGIRRGLESMVGGEGDLATMRGNAAGWVAKKFGASPEAQGKVRTLAEYMSPFPTVPWARPTTEDVRGVTDNAVGESYEPQTTAGKYARTVAEFLPAAVGNKASAAKRAAQVVVPAVSSEAAGQMTEGTWMEPYARTLAAVLAGVPVALSGGKQAAGSAIARATEGATQEQLQQAESLFQQALQQGTPITRFEALQKVTSGATKAGDIQRVVEGAGGLRDFMAPRAAQNDAAVRRTLDTVASASPAPSTIGPRVTQAARQHYADGPEGQGYAQRLFEAGPRTTAEEAGSVIQPELRQVYDRREGMRSALAEQDYGAARNAPATVPLDGGFGMRDVARHEDWTNIPIIADKAEREAYRATAMREGNSVERLPVIGLEPTQFGQIDASGVVKHIDTELQTAKGSVAEGLRAAKAALVTPGGKIDTSVAGLHGSRVAITDLIDQAKRAGANNAVRELEGALGALDKALERVPQYASAKKNFEAASQPLAPFREGRVPGKVVERDQYGRDFTMPPENVPRAIEQGGASAARDFNEVAGGPAREAYEGYITTQFLDAARREGKGLSAQAIRDAIRQNEDALRQFPIVRQRLENIAIARESLDRALVGPLGQLAKKDVTTQQAMEALFPRNPLPNSADEIGRTVGALAAKNPWAARQLVRAHIESTFNQAARELQSGANQFGGAGFAAALRGNPQQAANLEAAVKALGNKGGQYTGEQVWDGFNRFLAVLEAQGQRQRIGSQTAFNADVLKDLQAGSPMGTAATLAAGGGLSWPRKALEVVERWRLGRNVDEIARLITDPGGAGVFAKLAGEKNRTRLAGNVLRLVFLARQGAASAEKPVGSPNNSGGNAVARQPGPGSR